MMSGTISETKLSTTFPTEVAFSERPASSWSNISSNEANIKLPSSVNLIALRESFLSEAPFVSSSNRSFWRRMVDGKYFQNLLAASYHIIVNCISDSGVVDIGKINDISSSRNMNHMASNLAEMFFATKLRERELFFLRLPELLAFMLISSLRTSIPKYYRLCQTSKFREILLDWTCEIVGGIRFTNCRTNREWFFNDVLDGPILTTTPLPAPPKSIEGNAVTKYHIGNSPLISLYMQNSHVMPADHSVHISMTHNPTRTLTSLNAESIEHLGKTRIKKMDYDKVSLILKQTATTRKKVLSQHLADVKATNKDVRKMRKKRNLLLKTLNDQSKSNTNGHVTALQHG